MPVNNGRYLYEDKLYQKKNTLKNEEEAKPTLLPLLYKTHTHTTKVMQKFQMNKQENKNPLVQSLLTYHHTMHMRR